LLDDLEVEWVKDTRLVEVAYTSPSAAYAAEVANAFAEEFIEQHDEQQFESVTKVADFLGTQLQNLKVKVEESEQALLDYARENDIVRNDELESIDVKKLADLSDELTQVESELTQKAAQYQAILSATPDNFPPSLSTKTIDTLRERLANLKGDRAESASQRGPNWPGLVALEEEIRQIEYTLEIEKQAALSEARSEYQLALDRHNRLSTTVEAQRTVVDQVSANSIQYNILKRDVETNQGLYEGLLLRLKEAGVATGLSSGNIFVTDPAVAPRLPASPKRVLSLALALVVGLGLGVVAALVAEGLDDSVKTLDDVTQGLSLPALGSVPSMTTEGEAPLRAWWPARKAEIEEPPHPLLASEAEGDLSLKAKEAYRMLRTSLLLSHSDRPPSVILVTSAVPRDGKTTTAANLAIALSQTGKRTVLVDLDLRKPDLARLFHVTERSGLSNYLSGNASLGEQIRDTAHPQLQVVTAGPQAPNPTELIISQRMSTGLRYLRENFAYTIIDSPPALSVADALALSHLVDGIIVVVRSGATPKTALVGLVGKLRDAKAQLLGVVLNDVDYRRLGYGRSQYLYAYDYYVRPREGAAEVPETGS
jgi:capsular exopolysaccharide synthesis family protein